MGAVEADELIIGRVIVGRADDMSPPGLKSPFLTDFDKSCFLSYLGVAVVYSPFIPSSLLPAFHTGTRYQGQTCQNLKVC